MQYDNKKVSIVWLDNCSGVEEFCYRNGANPSNEDFLGKIWIFQNIWHSQIKNCEAKKCKNYREAKLNIENAVNGCQVE